MKSADTPYLLVLSCADALTELVKVRALADQADSFRPKLGELSDFLSKYSEVRNELGKRLLSGRLNDTELTLVHERLLSLSELSDSLGALATNTELQLCKNLPALTGEMANEVNSWQVNASQSGTDSLDNVLKCGHELKKVTENKVRKAGEVDSILCEARILIEDAMSPTDCSQHTIFKAAAELLNEAQSITSEKLNDLLTQSKQWSDDHTVFSKNYENLIQLLAKGVDELDRIMATSTDACRQSLSEYYGKIAAWLAEVRTFLKRAAKISSRSALALGEHSKLKQSYSDSQNLIKSLRSKIAECESKFSDEEYASAVKAARKKNFVIALFGTFGAAIGFFWLSDYASMFAVAVVIGASGLLFTKVENKDESFFWPVSILLILGLSAVGVLFMGADWLLGWLFNSWSLIGWLPKWLVSVIPLTFGAILALSYSVIMCCLVFRNFLPFRRKKSQVWQSPQNEFPAEDSEPFFSEPEAIQSSNGRESRLVPPPCPKPPPPPLPLPSRPAVKSTTRVPTRPAITPPPPPKPAAQTKSAMPSGTDSEPTYSSHLLEADIPPQLLSRIRDRVKREYRGDTESQRSELESQMESYRTLQEIVAQPPDGLDDQTLAKIVSRAQREYPLDLQMQLHEVEQQIEGHAEVEHFSDSANHSDVPRGILNKIILKAKREHSNNFSLQSHEMQEQMSAYVKLAEIRSSPPPGMNRKEMAKAISDAEREYPDDYSMQVYLIEQGFEDDAE